MEIIMYASNSPELLDDSLPAPRVGERYITTPIESVLPPQLRTAPQFLTVAADTLEQRGKQYDQPAGERSMGKCVAAFNTITGQNLSEAEGWLLLQVLKDVRQWQRPGYHQDSAEDCIAYAALKAEAKQHEAAKQEA